ncbi:hypothetical protein M406DRAFT_222325, partial [Cryphonectria parasitica EP155]
DFLVAENVSPGDFTLLVDNWDLNRPKIRLRRYDDNARKLYIVIPADIHEGLHAELYQQYMAQLFRMSINREWRTMAASTRYGRSDGNSGGGGAGEGDSTGGPKPERAAKGAWPTLVIEAGNSEPWQHLRSDMEWWFSASDHDVKIVLLVKFDPRRQELVLEKWEEEVRGQRPGATTTRSPGALAPVMRQIITITKTSSTTYNVSRGALVLSFRLLFLRDPDLGEGDIVISVQDLEEYAANVW